MQLTLAPREIRGNLHDENREMLGYKSDLHRQIDLLQMLDMDDGGSKVARWLNQQKRWPRTVMRN